MTQTYTRSEGKRYSRGWYHFPCPKCDDPSTHFGVNQNGLGKCLRCGHTETVRLTSGGSEGEDAPPRAVRFTQSLPEPSTYRISDILAPRGAYVLPWDTISPTTLESLGATVVLDRSRGFVLRLPFEGGAFTDRYLDGGQPKTKFSGIPQPYHLIPHQGDFMGCVVVEGWADGAALPTGYRALVLRGLGTTHLHHALALLKGHRPIYWAMDNDGPGRHHQILHILRCLLDAPGLDMRRVRYEGKDPAEAGPVKLLEALKLAKPITTINEVFDEA